jgi:hypothetical protein
MGTTRRRAVRLALEDGDALLEVLEGLVDVELALEADDFVDVDAGLEAREL